MSQFERNYRGGSFSLSKSRCRCAMFVEEMTMVRRLVHDKVRVRGVSEGHEHNRYTPNLNIIPNSGKHECVFIRDWKSHNSNTTQFQVSMCD